LAGQFLVVSSRLQINNLKIRQTSAEVAICRSLAAARAAFAAAIAEKPAARFMMRSRTRVVKRYPEGDC
jgi:hypothetical protein